MLSKDFASSKVAPGTIATLIENSVNFFEYEKNSTDNIAMLRRVLLQLDSLMCSRRFTLEIRYSSGN